MTVPNVPPAPSGGGAELLDDVLAVFRTFTVQPSEHAYVALTVYSAYTHAAGCFDFAPRLVLTSAEKRSGKTRTMEIVSTLSARPLIAANATVAALFRSLDHANPPTICLDEADTIFGTRIKAEQNEDLRGLLNAGFQRGTPVLRTVGPNHDVAQFETFAPAVLAAIGTLPDTITDRAVNIRLRRRKPTETVSQYRIRRHQPHLLDLRARLTDWISTHLDTLTGADPDTPLEDRAADVWEPLFAVADLAGGRWPALTRDAAVHLASEAAEHDSEASEGMELLRDIRNALTMLTSDFVPSTNLITLLKSAEESRWDETGLTARRLADLLKPYQIRPRHSASGNARGYRTREFEDAFARYLPDHRHNPSEPSETPPDQHKRSDTLKPSDTSNRQTETNRQNVSPGQTPYLTHLTGSDNPQAEHDHTTNCEVCGKPLNDHYIALNRTTHPGCYAA